MVEFNRYVDANYNDLNYFTRSDDNIYVADDYYASGYTVYTADAFTDLQSTVAVSAAATVVPGVSITVNITASIPTAIATKVVFGSATNNSTVNLSSTPTRQRTSTATLTHAGDDVQWQFADTWAEPKQETWRKRVVVSAQRVVKAPNTTFDIVTGLNSNSANTRTHSATANAAATVDSSYVRIRPGSATHNSTSTLSCSGISARLGNATLNIVAAQSSLGQAQFYGTTTLNAATTTLQVGITTRFARATLEATRSPKTITVYPTTTISTAQKKFGTHSVAYPNIFDFVRVSPDLVFGRGDFTVDMWIYKANIITGNYTMFDNRSGTDGVVVRIQNNAIGVLSTGYSQFVFSPGNQFSNSTWHQLSFQRSGTDFKVYVDGTLVLTTTVQNNNWSNRTVSVGNLLTSPIGFTGGYIDEIRFSSVARYSGNFVSPVEAYTTDLNTRFLLHADSGFVDQSIPKSLSVAARRLRTSSFNGNGVFETTVLPTRITPFASTLNINSLQTAIASITRTGTSSESITAQSTALGGKLIGIANKILPIDTGFTSSGLLLTVDPLRLVRVLPETRTWSVDTENRGVSVLAETRTRMVDTENRGVRVLPETRIKPALEEI